MYNNDYKERSTTKNREKIKMNENLELKDELYYNDLIYEIEGLIHKSNRGIEAVDKRIKLRKQDVEVEENGIITKRKSEYAKDLLEILERVKIKQQSGENHISLLREEIKLLRTKRLEAIFRYNPIVPEHPTPEKKYTIHEGHKGFVEWQPMFERYEVPGLMPKAPQKDPNKIHPRLKRNKKPIVW